MDHAAWQQMECPSSPPGICTDNPRKSLQEPLLRVTRGLLQELKPLQARNFREVAPCLACLVMRSSRRAERSHPAWSQTLHQIALGR